MKSQENYYALAQRCTSWFLLNHYCFLMSLLNYYSAIE